MKLGVSGLLQRAVSLLPSLSQVMLWKWLSHPGPVSGQLGSQSWLDASLLSCPRKVTVWESMYRGIMTAQSWARRMKCKLSALKYQHQPSRSRTHHIKRATLRSKRAARQSGA